ncbi:MAG: hypothetical protein ACYDH5_00945 [Acidimicrobiales bacterium]
MAMPAAPAGLRGRARRRLMARPTGSHYARPAALHATTATAKAAPEERLATQADRDLLAGTGRRPEMAGATVVTVPEWASEERLQAAFGAWVPGEDVWQELPARRIAWPARPRGRRRTV